MQITKEQDYCMILDSLGLIILNIQNKQNPQFVEYFFFGTVVT